LNNKLNTVECMHLEPWYNLVTLDCNFGWYWKLQSVIFTMWRYASVVYAVALHLSICLSCLSVTSWYCTKMAEHRITQTKIIMKFEWGHPSVGTKSVERGTIKVMWRWVILKLAISRQYFTISKKWY